MAKLWSFDSEMLLRSIPVVVTSAEMCKAEFDHNKIDPVSGQVAAADLKLSSVEFCAVNYRPDDELALTMEPPPTRTSIGLNFERFSYKSDCDQRTPQGGHLRRFDAMADADGVRRSVRRHQQILELGAQPSHLARLEL